MLQNNLFWERTVSSTFKFSLYKILGVIIDPKLPLALYNVNKKKKVTIRN